MIIRECYQQLHAHKFDNLEKTDQFLERIMKLIQKESYNLNSPISVKEVELLIRHCKN